MQEQQSRAEHCPACPNHAVFAIDKKQQHAQGMYQPCRQSSDDT
jgi:hypothetical protein